MDALSFVSGSYVSGPSHVPLLGHTIGAALSAAAGMHGGRPAVSSLFQGAHLTYADLDRAADEVARGLLAAGVRPGERVGLWSANRWEWLAVHHGAVRVGAVVVPINPAFRAAEVRYIAEDAGVGVLFASRGFRAFAYGPVLEELRGAGAVGTVVALDEDAAVAGATRWGEFLAGGRSVGAGDLERRAAAVGFDDACHLQYTSGTTGRPKGAVLTHHNVLNNGFHVGERQRLTERDSICLPVPFFHCFGSVLGALAALTHASELVLPDESFDPAGTLRAVAARRCTALYGVPMMFIAMLDDPSFPEHDLGSLRTGCMGAAPCPLTTMKGAVERMNMREITVVYGMTETSPISFQSRPDDDDETRVATVGAIHPHLEAKIVDPLDGSLMPRGRAGELCVRGYSVMRGYWNREEETRRSIDRQRWMHSGDLAVMRPDGYVQIVGRLKDTIIRGGENIYPREIEEFLLTLEDVAEAYVFGVEDAKYGEEVCAWIRLRPEAGATGAPASSALRERCRGRIATYKIPRVIRIVSEFPTTASGKVQKFRMREIEEAERRSEMAHLEVEHLDAKSPDVGHLEVRHLA